jgi:transcriptional regulator with XRE-family HTH domain
LCFIGNVRIDNKGWNAVPTKLGSIIKQARTASNKSLRDVDAMTGIPYGALSRIETGFIKQPSFRTVVLLARHLKIDLERLADTI